MRLIINRRQDDVTGLFGGHKGVSFTLSYRLELTSAEADLVSRYRLENYPVTYQNVGNVQAPDDTIANMLIGRQQKLPDVVTLIKNENVVKSACDGLPPLFLMCASFGGDEVIEYPRGDDDG